MKQYNFRLEPESIKAIDGLGGCRSNHIRSAISEYLQTDIQPIKSNVYTTELIDVLKGQIVDLKNDKNLLQQRVDYFSMSWFQRLLLPKHSKK